jgi:magnesium transporter
MNAQFNHTHIDPNTAPGIEYDEIMDRPGGKIKAMITCIDYSPSDVLVQKVEDLEDFMTHHRPDWSAVRWISVVGLSDMDAIHALATKYELHPLAVEDVLQARQRPKVEAYGGEESELQARLFIVTRMLYIKEERLRGFPILKQTFKNPLVSFVVKRVFSGD